MTDLATKPFCYTAFEEGRNGPPMTARIISKNKDFSNPQATSFSHNEPMEVIQAIKSELEKSGSESYFIGKRVEDALAQVYFSTSY